MYDHIIITAILVVDSIGLWFMIQDHTRRRRARNTRKFNRILQSIGLR